MKRVVAIVLAVVLVFSMITLAACAQQECEICGKTSGVRAVSFEGERGYLCNDCIRDLRSIGLDIR